MGDHYITGYVYFVQAGDHSAVKIGHTIEPLGKRLLALQTGNHQKLRLIGAIDLGKTEALESLNRIEFSKLARKKEAEIHALFSKERIQGEWFNLSNELVLFIAEVSNVQADAWPLGVVRTPPATRFWCPLGGNVSNALSQGMSGFSPYRQLPMSQLTQEPPLTPPPPPPKTSPASLHSTHPHPAETPTSLVQAVARYAQTKCRPLVGLGV
jgi:hypothetical protein